MSWIDYVILSALIGVTVAIAIVGAVLAWFVYRSWSRVNSKTEKGDNVYEADDLL